MDLMSVKQSKSAHENVPWGAAVPQSALRSGTDSSMAGSKSPGRKFSPEAHAKKEKLKELQQIRTC